MIIATRIKEIRIEHKLSQAKFAETLSVSQNMVSFWECGKGFLHLQHVIKICKIYNVSADYLLGLEKI